MRERGRKWYKERGKWIIESRIEFPDPMFMILDTPQGPNAKFLKTMTGKCGKGGKWDKERGKCIIESRIEFPVPILMTVDTSHGPITKFLKKCPKNAGKMGKIFFSPLWCLIQKLDHNSGLHAKNQREISKNEVRSRKWKCMEMYGSVDIPL